MNKLLTKIVGAALGLTMTVGVGVAVASNQSVAKAEAADVKDTLVASSFAATNTTYTDFSNVSFTSDAVYAGNNGKTSSGGIQLRSKNSNSGIVTTASGGTLKSISITVESGSNTLDVYGKTTAYSSVSDLYATATQGTKIGSGNATGAITLTNPNDYTYIGLRSNSGALYLTSIEITWTTSGGGSSSTIQSVSITGAPQSTVTGVNVGSTGASLTATATMRTGTDTPTWTWASDNESAVKVSAAGQLSYIGNGTAHISATASLPAGDQTGDTNVGTVTVTTSNLTGSSTNPFTVAQALEVVAATGSTATTYDCYTSATVSRVKEETYSSQYGNKTFWVSTDGTTTNEIEVYRCLYLNNQKMTEAQFNSIEAGDSVTIVGKLINYNGDTPEYTSGCYLAAHTKPVLPRVNITESSQSINVGETLQLHATTENPVEGSSIIWVSGTPAVATIGESTGLVTAVSGGTTSITAKMIDGNDDVVATSAAITITVIEPLLSDGDKFEIYYGEVGSEVYFTGISNNIGSHGTDEEEAIVFTAIESETSGQFALSFGDQYLSYSGSDNKIYSSSTNNSDATLWTAENNGTYDVIESVNVAGRRIRYNTNSGQERFCCYANTSNIHIRKIVVADPTVLTMNTKTLSLEAEEVSEALTFTTDSPSAAFHWYSEDTTKATVSNGVVTAGTQTDTSVKIYVYFDTDGSGDFDPAEDLNDYCTVTITAPIIDYSSITFGGIGTKVTALSGLSAGDKIIFSNNEDTDIAGPAPLTSGVISNSSATFSISDSKMTIGDGTEELDALVLKVATYNSSTGDMTLKSGDKWLVSTAAKKCHLADTEFTWTLSFEDGQAILTSSRDTADHMQYNYNNGSPRFAPYASTQTAINIWKVAEYVDEAETYADLFLESSLCGSNDNTKASASIWSDLKDAFNDDLSTGAQNVLKTATANKDSTDSIQKCLAKYDRVIYLHYGAEPLAYPDFMNRVANNYVTPLSNPRIASSSQTTNVAAIVAIVSVISLSAVAGYFMLRKRKEQ